MEGENILEELQAIIEAREADQTSKKVGFLAKSVGARA